MPFGVPFRPSPFRVAFDLAIGGEAVTVDRVVEYRYSHIVAGEKRSELNVSPAFNVTLDPDIVVVPQDSVASAMAEIATRMAKEGRGVASVMAVMGEL